MPTSVAFVPPNQPPTAVAPESRKGEAIDAGDFKPFGKDGLTFDDVLDVVNPLHHIPVVGFIYRAITGDTISAASKITGGTLFGGVFGLVSAIADTILEETSGKDAGGHVMALMEAQENISSKQGKPREAPWSETASLRHDAHEYEDGFWEDPDAVINTDNIAAVQRSASVAPVVVPPAAKTLVRDPARPGSVEAATGPKKYPFAAATHTLGRRALNTSLPRPQTLAANPRAVTAMRYGNSPYFKPGGTINTDSWLKLMNNASANRGANPKPTGASGLTSATLAKALAIYGSAQASTPSPAKDSVQALIGSPRPISAQRR